MTDSTLGKTLRELRNHYEMTQQQVSEKLNISRQAYAAYESGSRVPNLEMACSMAALFHVTLEQLVFGIHKRPPEPDDVQFILNIYHGLSNTGKERMQSYARFLEKEDINNL